MKVYGDWRSGNCYKVGLLLSLLERPFEWIDVDVLGGETRTAQFQVKNPNAKIPVVEFDDGRTLWESNAILFYLAQGTSLLPQDLWLQAQVLQWQFFEQYSHEPYIAVARFINVYLGMPAERRAEFEDKQVGGYKALDVMEAQLQKQSFLVGDRFSVADISLYGYTHVAGEGGFDLSRYPCIRAWIARIEALPGYRAMG